MDLQIRLRRENGRSLGVLVWRFDPAVRAVSSAPHGGGLGPRRWIVNAQVPAGYARRDPGAHLAKLGVSLGLPGRGVGLLTAADVSARTTGRDGGVEATATVGLGHPVLAAAPDEAHRPSLVGTVNLVVALPERMADAALVNLVATATEAKVQALRDAGLHATGTATDAVCVVCPDEGRAHDFGGPRSLWGARAARAVYTAVADGFRP
ncbi:MAG: adenosylcobinamide amidohydrolase [Acidimicrobiales bacterium]